MEEDGRIKREIQRLKGLFKEIPKDKQKLLEGLFVQSARLRIRLDDLWEDVQLRGEYEMFSQSEKTEAYERERPAARLFTATDKNYQAVMRQLVDMLPETAAPGVASELDKFLKKRNGNKNA